MPARCACLALAALALAAAPAGADVRLARGSTAVRALAAGGTTAFAVVDSRVAARPFAVVRATSRGARRAGTYGTARDGDPDIAADAAGRAVVGWAHPVSGGLALLAARVGGARAHELTVATGPAPLAAGPDGAVVAAHPDRLGDATLTTVPGITARARRPDAQPQQVRLSADAPRRRHRPIDVVLSPRGAVVLDLVQQRGRTELRVLGPGAPARAVLAVDALREVPATLAVSGGRIAVAYRGRDRAVLATSAGSGWRRRTLSPRAGVEGAPAVAFDRGRVVVAWTQRPAPGAARDLYAYTRGRLLRVTRTRGDESAPLAADRAGAGVFLAWTRRDGTRRTPLLRVLR
ncbi:MAG TPA: hypothetical protein VM266_12780 [Solirubrobacteraceae bacterium]|nr:hypothetical protein [Solirubrobacteraceae bacterium]